MQDAYAVLQLSPLHEPSLGQAKLKTDS